MARCNEYSNEKIYKIYVTDALKAIGSLDVRYVDLINNKPQDTRTPEEIISGIKEKLRQIGEE